MGSKYNMTETLGGNKTSYAYDAATHSSAITDLPIISLFNIESDTEPPSTTTSIGFLTRDPIGYADEENLYQFVKGNSLNALDPSGLLTIKHVSDNFKDFKKCGGNATMSWKFELSGTAAELCPNTRKGYIVQKLTVFCYKSKCEESGDCDSTKATTESGTYFEYWEVNGSSNTLVNANGVTDSSSGNPGQENNCGHYSAFGTVRFYCSDKVDDYIASAVTPPSTTVCGKRTYGGILSGWNIEPGFWTHRGDDGKIDRGDDGEGFRNYSRHWRCCKCDKSNFDVVVGSPGK